MSKVGVLVVGLVGEGVVGIFVVVVLEGSAGDVWEETKMKRTFWKTLWKRLRLRRSRIILLRIMPVRSNNHRLCDDADQRKLEIFKHFRFDLLIFN